MWAFFFNTKENDMSKRISAIIALDSEKKFKDDVTSVNKSLSNLKSELSLMKKFYIGKQALGSFPKI